MQLIATLISGKKRRGITPLGVGGVGVGTRARARCANPEWWAGSRASRGRRSSSQLRCWPASLWTSAGASPSCSCRLLFDALQRHAAGGGFPVAPLCAWVSTRALTTAGARAVPGADRWRSREDERETAARGGLHTRLFTQVKVMMMI